MRNVPRKWNDSGGWEEIMNKFNPSVQIFCSKRKEKKIEKKIGPKEFNFRNERVL